VTGNPEVSGSRVEMSVLPTTRPEIALLEDASDQQNTTPHHTTRSILIFFQRLGKRLFIDMSSVIYMWWQAFGVRIYDY
jgi:hypothetical protein